MDGSDSIDEFGLGQARSNRDEWSADQWDLRVSDSKGRAGLSGWAQVGRWINDWRLRSDRGLRTGRTGRAILAVGSGINGGDWFRLLLHRETTGGGSPEELTGARS